MTTSEAPSKQKQHWYQPQAIWQSIVLHARVYLGASAAIATALLLPPDLSGPVREAMAWCVGGLVYLTMAFHTISQCHVEHIKSRAARQDDSAVVILVVILVAVLSSFMAIAGLMSEAKAAHDNARFYYVIMAALTIFIAWLVMQVVFTLHYAHEHYAPHNLKQDSPGGLEFPKDPHPDYWDFFYFATSIGAASQTSDVSVISKGLRHLVTLHAIVAFFFNTMVLALSINLAGSLV